MTAAAEGQRAVARTEAHTAAAPDRFSELKHMIGNTPPLEIRLRFRGEPRTVYAKAEHLNMTGSIKDRTAFHILRTAYREGRVRPGDLIAEATSGNTGISFAAIGRALGHGVRVFMPDWMSRERVALIESLGAEVVPVSRDEGGFLGSIRLAEELAPRDPRVFLPRQFSNSAPPRSSPPSSPTTTKNTSAPTSSAKSPRAAATSRPTWNSSPTAPSAASATPASRRKRNSTRNCRGVRPRTRINSATAARHSRFNFANRAATAG